MECHICKEQINKSNGRHVYGCATKNKIEKDSKEVRYDYICHNIGKIPSKEELVQLYEVEGWSLVDFQNNWNIPYHLTQALLDYFGIKRRNIKEANGNLQRQAKFKKTCQEKYGVDNVSQLDEVKKKKEETFTENYGVDNIWKSPEYYKWLHQHMLNKYGVKSLPNRYGGINKWWENPPEGFREASAQRMSEISSKWWANLSNEEKNEAIEIRVKSAKNHITLFTSKIEGRVSASLTALDIPYRHQYWVKQKSFDFQVSYTKILIEVNGDFWHANPQRYCAEDTLNMPGGLVKAFDLWERDKAKRELAESYGYSVVYIWETEINNCDDLELEELILKKIGDKSNEGQIDKKD